MADPIVVWQLTRREFTAVLLIILFATAMRLYGLGARPLLWQDELGLWEYILTGDASWMPQEAPLYSRLQFIWMWWIQTPTANTMRLLSVAFGVLGVFAAFILGRLIGGVRVGLLAAVLLSISPMALGLAHEVRPYTLFILASAMLLSCFLAAWERNTPRAWLGYGLALTTALLTHLLAAQLCVALGMAAAAAIWLERHRPQIMVRFLSFAVTSVVFGLLGAAWVGFHHSRRAFLTGPHTLGPLDFVQGSITSLGGVVESQIPVAVTLAVLATVGLVVLARRQPMHAILLSSVIVISCLITYATMAEMSAWGWNAWQRYLSHLLIPYLVLIAIGALWLARAVARRFSGLPASALAAAVTLVPILLVVPGTRHWLDSPNRHPD
ncbi:MAG: glycosyltransferase family 39 protein, partial [Deltaproteobacteria bacterium]|nr:glycosyltransferase family 39 protein [Deltaproteobacteria bacterium]